MHKDHTFDQHFYDFLFEYIVDNGGLRLQVIASDLVKDLQEKHGAKDPVNLFRKQYGNIFQALKAIKNQFYILDNMVIRMKKPEQVRLLKIRQDLMAKYEVKLKFNREEQIKIMKINNQNQCSLCSQVFNVNVNKPGSCAAGKQHKPKY